MKDNKTNFGFIMSVFCKYLRLLSILSHVEYSWKFKENYKKSKTKATVNVKMHTCVKIHQ